MVRKKDSENEDQPAPQSVRGDISDVTTWRTILAWSYGGKKRLKAEKKLQESEERYRSLFENSPDAILLAGPDWSIQPIRGWP